MKDSYNEDANKVGGQTEHENATRETLKFFYLATIIIVAEDRTTMEKEPKVFNKVWNNLDVETQKT